MPGPNMVLDKGFQPTAAVGMFKCVKLASTAQKVTMTTTDELVIGVCQEEITTADATAGRVANIRMMGISRCIADGALVIGDRVGAGASGKVTKTGLATGDALVGIVLETAAADGDQVDVFLTLGAKF